LCTPASNDIIVQMKPDKGLFGHEVEVRDAARARDEPLRGFGTKAQRLAEGKWMARDDGAGGVPEGPGSRDEREARAKRMREFGRRPGMALPGAKPIGPPATQGTARCSMGERISARSGRPWTDVKPRLFYSCKTCNGSLWPTEWRILIARFPTYVDGKV